MTGRYVIQRLDATHDRQAFTCGVGALDRYFRELVTQDIRRRVTNCFVAVATDGSVAGYYTFAATSLPLTDLRSEEIKRLPRYPLLPAALIGRLAVSEQHRGQGLGAALVVDSIERATRVDIGIYAIIVDAKDETAASFYAHLGFQAFPSRRMTLFLPVAEALRRLKAQN